MHLSKETYDPNEKVAEQIGNNSEAFSIIDKYILTHIHTSEGAAYILGS